MRAQTLGGAMRRMGFSLLWKHDDRWGRKGTVDGLDDLISVQSLEADRNVEACGLLWFERSPT